MNHLLKFKTGFIKNSSILNSVRRNYTEKLVNTFKNPKNVGSLDKNDPNVGTGLVGAPACFHQDTLVVTESGLKTLKEIYESDSILTVLSFNLVTKEYEYKNAKAVKLQPQLMYKVNFNENTDDKGSIICTLDHKFLIRDTLLYIENEFITSQMSIVPFKRRVKENKEVSFCNGYKKYGHNITSRESADIFDCYTLQVEENNNYIVIISGENDNMQRGIVVKNCGDVMKLQIKVDDKGNIIESKFKTFGCASAISSSSLATELIQGKNINEALQITNKDIADMLNLPPVKKHCSLLAEDSIKSAIDDYKRKQSKKVEKKKEELILPDVINL